MQKYYGLTHTTAFERIGNVFPQATAIYTHKILKESVNGDGKRYQAYETMQQIDKHQVADGIIWEFELYKKTMFTDVLSSASAVTKGLLISEALYRLLLNYNLSGVDFIPSLVHSKKETKSYHYLFTRQPLVDQYIDLANTTFVLLDNTDKNFRLEYKAKNKQDYQQRMWNALRGPRYLSTLDGLYLKDFAPVADLIELERFGRHLYISAKLKNMLADSAITGLEIHDEITIHQS